MKKTCNRLSLTIGFLILQTIFVNAQDSLSTYRPADTSNFSMVRELISNENLAIKQNPKSLDAYVKRACYYRHLCKYQASIADFKKAIELEPDSHLLSALHYWIGGGLDRINDFKGAIEHFTLAIESGKNHIGSIKKTGIREMDMDINIPRLYYDRGLVKNRLKQYQSALDDFNLALEYYPDWSEAYFGMGLSYERQEKYDSAIYFYKKAINENMYLVSAYNNVASIYTTQKNYTQALKYYEKAIMLEPSYEFPYGGLMDLKLEMGDKEGACITAKRYIKIFGGFYPETNANELIKKYCEGK